MSTEAISSYSETNNRIPVLAEDFTGYKLQTSNGAGWHTFHTVTGLTPANSTEDAVDYINTSQGGAYAQRVVVEFSTGADEIIYVEYQECNKYGYTPAYFVNRFGAMQQVHLTGKFSISMRSEDTKYTRNILENGSYNEFRHQQYILNKNGKVSLEFNTGWVPEERKRYVLRATYVRASLVAG